MIFINAGTVAYILSSKHIIMKFGGEYIDPEDQSNDNEDCEREKGKDYVESPVFKLAVTPDALECIGICWHRKAIQTLSTECSLSVQACTVSRCTMMYILCC